MAASVLGDSMSATATAGGLVRGGGTRMFGGLTRARLTLYLLLLLLLLLMICCFGDNEDGFSFN